MFCCLTILGVVQRLPQFRIISAKPWFLFSSTFWFATVSAITLQTYKECVGFGVLTAVVMKTIIFWDITPRSPLNVNRRFGGIYLVHLQGRRISQARNHSVCHLLSSWFLIRLISLKPTSLQVKTFLRWEIMNQCLPLLHYNTALVKCTYRS
jgi:hypothetical protein